MMDNAAAAANNKMLLVIGSIVTIRFLFRSIQAFIATFLRPSKNVLKMGQWGVVTGATDGIGLLTAKLLAKSAPVVQD